MASASIPSGGGGKAVIPLVLWSSGCKDYRVTKLYGDPDLQPHTDSSLSNPPEIVRCQMDGALSALEVADTKIGFRVAVVRASPICGYGGTYCGAALVNAVAYAAS